MYDLHNCKPGLCKPEVLLVKYLSIGVNRRLLQPYKSQTLMKVLEHSTA